MAIVIHEEMVQGSEAWAAARCGLLTASEMKLIITPTLKVADNDKSRSHLYELLAQRITKYVEPRYVSDDMLRGQNDEIEALDVYDKNYAPIERVGFITNDKFGFTIGYSPDAMVGDDGQVECKSRRNKYQVKTIVTGEVPDEFIIQLQTGLLVTERKWVDFISYSGGLPMFVKRVEPDKKIQDAIIASMESFESSLSNNLLAYRDAIVGLIPTERRVEQEMFLGSPPVSNEYFDQI